MSGGGPMTQYDKPAAAPSKHPEVQALLAEGLCPSLADLLGGSDRTEACGQPLDPRSRIMLCAEHDGAFRRTYPHWYASLLARDMGLT